MGYLSAVQAGHYLGVAERTVRNMINRGELEVLSADPIRLDVRHVAQVLAIRQEAARSALEQLRISPVYLARETRRKLLRAESGFDTPERAQERRQRRLGMVSPEAKTTFGMAALAAVQSDGDGCRWCLSSEFARMLGGWAPEAHGEGFAALFDQEPCEVCGPRLYGAVLASLEARVHPGRHRPPDARAEAAAAVLPAPRPEPAQPLVGDGDGRELVARRLRETRARLKDAKRSGDQKYAIRLQQTLQALTADAARVDGPPVSAKPGVLRCGHLLAAGCACPRRASK